MSAPTRALLLGATLAALPAFAHFELNTPLVRYSNASGEINKHCPCGGGDGTSTCSGSVTSDPNRGTRFTTYGPGEVITVEWDETIGHTGRFRIAFDDDGADLEDFNTNILLDIADPSGSNGNTNDGNHWRAQVTLPTTLCDNCTLQVVQVMNGNANEPVASPAGSSTYFQCANIVIAEDGFGGAISEGEGEGGPDDGADDGGCAQTSTPATLAASVALMALLRRRRARR